MRQNRIKICGEIQFCSCSPNLLPFRLKWLAQVKADVNARKILPKTLSFHLVRFVTDLIFSLYANFFALVVDIGYSEFAMY